MDSTVQIETLDALDSVRNIYLSAPYRGASDVIDYRMRYVSSVVQSLRLGGHFITSALLHHWTIEATDESATSSYWLDYSAMLVQSLAALPGVLPFEVWVLCLPEWQKSTGVAVELKVARQYGVHIRYIQPIWYDRVREITEADALLID